jgi:membrane protein DedA with SNARE-associated domain
MAKLATPQHPSFQFDLSDPQSYNPATSWAAMILSAKPRARRGNVMEDAGHLVASLEPFVRDYGVFAVMLIVAIEAIGAPVPGESLLIFASVLAGRGELSLPGLLVFAWVGAVMGDNIGYAIGRSFGRGVILRYGARIGLNDARFNAIENVFMRYGSATVMFARFFAILRQLNGIVAGILGMSWWRFLLFNALGGALWVITWVFAGYYLTEHISVITTLAHHTKIVAGVLAVGILAFVVVKSTGPALRRASRALRR